MWLKLRDSDAHSYADDMSYSQLNMVGHYDSQTAYAANKNMAIFVQPLGREGKGCVQVVLRLRCNGVYVAVFSIFFSIS